MKGCPFDLDRHAVVRPFGRHLGGPQRKGNYEENYQRGEEIVWLSWQGNGSRVKGGRKRRGRVLPTWYMEIGHLQVGRSASWSWLDSNIPPTWKQVGLSGRAEWARQSGWKAGPYVILLHTGAVDHQQVGCLRHLPAETRYGLGWPVSTLVGRRRAKVWRARFSNVDEKSGLRGNRRSYRDTICWCQQNRSGPVFPCALRRKVQNSTARLRGRH